MAWNSAADVGRLEASAPLPAGCEGTDRNRVPEENVFRYLKTTASRASNIQNSMQTRVHWFMDSRRRTVQKQRQIMNVNYKNKTRITAPCKTLQPTVKL
jgi:hypothetical protein